jgi:hypothetical protein
VRPSQCRRAARRGSANTVEESENMKPARQSIRKARGCRGCPCRAPSGRCLDPRIKSGRCGDWVWYMRGNKQFRHLYVKLHDPRTPKQLHWRAHFGAASTKYSDTLTQEQRNARIAAGAKFRSRPRLAQSGPLTGQQYSIRVEYATNARARAESAVKAAKALQTLGLLVSTSGTHRSISRVPPDQGHRDTGRGSKKEGRRKNGECNRRKAGAASEARQAQRVTRSRWGRYRNTTRAVRWHAARSPGTFPVSGRASVRASPNSSRPRASQGSRRRSPSRRRFPWRGRAAGPVESRAGAGSAGVSAESPWARRIGARA